MIFVLSVIFAIVLPIASFILFIAFDVCNIFLAIVYAILIFFGVIAIFSSIILILLPTLGKHFAKLNDPKNKNCWRFMVDVARFSCFWLGIRIKVEGLEKLNSNETYVFYSNHQCFIDPLIYHKTLHKFPHATMYKEIINTYPLAASMAQALGGVSIARDDDRSAMESIVKIIKKVKAGINFFVFPEGTRSRGIGMHHFKAGSFKISQKANSKLVLLAIDGSYRRRLVVPFLYTPVYIKVVEVMDFDEVNRLSTHELASSCEKLVRQAIDEIREKHFVMHPSKRYQNKLMKQKEAEDVF